MADIFSIAALGDDPELEPSWTAISQSNQEWFSEEYLPTILDEHGEEKQVHIRDPTKMSVDERWACLEHWYSIGHLQMLAWKPRLMTKSLNPLPFEDCWWHSAFPGKQSRIRSRKRKRRTQPGRLEPQFPEYGEPLPGTAVSNSQTSRESVPGALALQDSQESTPGTPASEPWISQESQELIPGSFAISSRDPTPDSQPALPTQPYSANTALGRVPCRRTEAEIRRREGHAQYQLGLEQRRINREVRRAARQEALVGRLVQIPSQASDPDVGPTCSSAASPSNNEATKVDVPVSDEPSRSPRQLRKRKQNMAISDSESVGPLDNTPGASRHLGQPDRDSMPVPDSRSRKGSFVILLSPLRQPSKSTKHRSGK
jgi:hypothetical protein